MTARRTKTLTRGIYTRKVVECPGCGAGIVVPHQLAGRVACKGCRTPTERVQAEAPSGVAATPIPARREAAPK